MNESVPHLVLAGVASPVALDRDQIVVGRAPESDIHLDDDLVSRRHAVLERRSGQILLTDLGSSNGTYVNGARLQATVALNDGDHVRFADVEGTFRMAPYGVSQAPGQQFPPGQVSSPHSPTGGFPPPPVITGPQNLSDSPSALPSSLGQPSPRFPAPPSQLSPGPTPGDRSPLTPGRPDKPVAALESPGEPPLLITKHDTSVGRMEGNDLVVSDTFVSSHHARIVHDGDTFTLIDLNSSNGTYVNGQRLMSPCVLEQGDEVRLGDRSFIFRRLIPIARKRKGSPRAPGAQGRRPEPGPRT
jgi:pSer/pThr/pTyr-binding forkhead associated (FHA) protein